MNNSILKQNLYFKSKTTPFSVRNLRQLKRKHVHATVERMTGKLQLEPHYWQFAVTNYCLCFQSMRPFQKAAQRCCSVHIGHNHGRIVIWWYKHLYTTHLCLQNCYYNAHFQFPLTLRGVSVFRHNRLPVQFQIKSLGTDNRYRVLLIHHAQSILIKKHSIPYRIARQRLQNLQYQKVLAS